MDDHTELEEAIGRYMRRLGARWGLPAAAVAVAIVLAAVLALAGRTTTSGAVASSSSGASAAGAGSGSGSSGGGASGAGAEGGTGASDGGEGVSAVGGSGSGGGGAGSRGGGNGSSGGAVGSGAGSSSATGGSSATAGSSGSGGAGEPPGVAVSGVHCGSGVRQVAWSHYAPYCVPAWKGSNGGATAPGVTASTITLSYREANSSQQSAINAAAPGSVPNDQQYEADMRTYLALFNRTYELYGRQVKLVPFQGQGDYVAEDEGQDLPEAQADAATARDLGAFIDATFPTSGSIPYSEDLAADHIINWDAPLLPQSFYASESPWAYHWFMDGTEWEDWLTNLVCQRLSGLDATLAGDTVYQHEKRVFGLINLEEPYYDQVADQIADRLSGCGVKLAARGSYSEDLGTMETEATSLVAKMKAAGVTTVLCFCDPLIPIFATQQADTQDYRPEWVSFDYYDPVGRNAQQDQWSHALSSGPAAVPASRSEALAAFHLEEPHSNPEEQYYSLAYIELAQIFGALQDAGPDLTPETFQKGMFALPPSTPGGQFGDWAFGQDTFVPATDAQVDRWEPDAVSNLDGKTGAWVPCEGGSFFSFTDASDWAPARQPLSCPSS